MPKPPCDLCADRHRHFSIWVPFTWKEFLSLLFAAALLGFVGGMLATTVTMSTLCVPCRDAVRSTP